MCTVYSIDRQFLAVQMRFLYLSSSRSTSRRSLAQLFSTGFPQILDHQNQVAEVLDPSEPVNFDLQREEADHLQVNTLILQFLAFTRYVQFTPNRQTPTNSFVGFCLISVFPLWCLLGLVRVCFHLTDHIQSVSVGGTDCEHDSYFS